MRGVCRRAVLAIAALTVLASCSALLSLGDYHETTVLPCAHNSECISRNAGQPAVCKTSHTCAPLLSPECVKVVGPIDDDNAIVIGTIFSLTGTNQSSGVARTNSVELALGEISQTIVGVPGGAGGKPRPLVALECDDTSDNTVASRAANHLHDVGVVAVIGPGGSGQVSAVAQSVTIPGGMFLISPSATSTSLSGLNALVWRTAPSDTVQVIALRDQIAALETQVRADNPTLTNVKLAIVYQANPYGQGLFDGVSKGLSINGAPIGDAKNQGLYEPRSYDGNTLDPSSIAVSMLAENPPPNIIALFGTSEVTTKLIAPVEQGWPSGPPRPMYLLSDGGKKQELLDLAKGNDPLRLRVRGTVPGTNSALFQTFSLHYQAKFGSLPNVFGTAGAYDSTYILAYTIASLGAKAPTGASIADAMKKVVGGTKLAIGPDTLSTAMQALGAGGALDVDGASGPLDFDLSLHEALSDIDLWCVRVFNGVDTFASSGRRYDSVTQKMVGAFSCP